MAMYNLKSYILFNVWITSKWSLAQIPTVNKKIVIIATEP